MSRKDTKKIPVDLKKIPELTQSVEDKLSEIMFRHGLSDVDVKSLSAEFISWMKDHFGGLQIYFPKGIYDEAKERASAIKNDYDTGLTLDSLSKKYKLTRQRIYGIIFEK
ncbi:MAG: hypothetical protein HQM10_26840 [Candidatus Riflebacteria bacterium]|nr:hypothetical protein [Candidatus Riflebacteria bacterium]